MDDRATDPTMNPRLLLVDDEEEFLVATKKALRRRSIEVTVASNGHEALALMARAAFDVVVLDIRMPAMGGERTFEHLRRQHPGVPVIVLTGHGSIAQGFQMSKDGVFDYVGKPCEPDDLARLVRRAAAAAEPYASGA